MTRRHELHTLSPPVALVARTGTRSTRASSRDETETVARACWPASPLDRRRARRRAWPRPRPWCAARARQRRAARAWSRASCRSSRLGTREGLALMCLAEALLRTPDEETRDRLIAEKIGSADWASHLGQSDSLFVNASTWGLMLTGKLVDVDEEAKTRPAAASSSRVAGASGRAGDPPGRGRRRAHHGRAVRARPHHRGGAAARAKREGWLCSLRHAGRGRPHRRRRRALRAASTPTPSQPSASTAKGAGAGGRPRRLGQAVGPVAALRGDAGGAGLGRALSAHPAPGADRRRRTTSTSPSTPRRPTGWPCR